MSRGFWDYKNEYLKDEIFGWMREGEKVPNVFEDKEISEIIFDMFGLLYAFDSYKCGDWGEDSWLEEKSKFKNKWLSQTADDRVKRIVESSLAEMRNEIYKTFDVKEN